MLDVTLLTAWDLMHGRPSGMSQYYRGLQGDGTQLAFQQQLLAARLGLRLPTGLNNLYRHWFHLRQRTALKRQPGTAPWLLGGQQFIHLFPAQALRTAAVVVFDILALDYPDFERVGRSPDRIEKRLRNLQHPLKIITISEYVRRRLIDRLQLPPERISVVHCGVDLNVFQPVSQTGKQKWRDRLGIPSAAFVVLYVGSEQRRKNLAPLVHGLGQLKNTLPNLLFVKIGAAQSDAGHAQFLQAIADAGLEAQTIVREHVAAADLPGWYAGADLFAFPSLAEGFGLPPLEAMASGVPVLTTDRTSVPEIVGDAAVVVPEPQSPAAWATDIDRLISTPALRQKMGELGRRRAQRFSWERSRMQFIKVWESLLT